MAFTSSYTDGLIQQSEYYYGIPDVSLTGSFTGSFTGDGSGLSGVGSFPFSGSAVITGSLTVSQSIVDFTSASAVYLPVETVPLINPVAEYETISTTITSGTEYTLPNGLTYVSSSVYEYIEIFANQQRLSYAVDFIPLSTSSIQFTFTVPNGSDLTYKVFRRP
jgi:hypothetical protein